jgi:NAD(P)-dependent dehydrogenase (short-subunit alcohol dehydrogenase family)
MAGICTGRVVVVTGAGRGLGRAHALAFGAEGAQVVVNDLGVGLDGAGGSAGPAQAVADEIRSLGGEAVANGDDIATTEGARGLLAAALDSFGHLDTLVNNAGFLRDRMLVNLDEEDWDARHPRPPQGPLPAAQVRRRSLACRNEGRTCP